jgi:hypothetical protein
MTRFLSLILIVSISASCSDNTSDPLVQQSSELALKATDTAAETPAARTAGYNEERNAYFGDLHVHTMYSFDAFIFGTTSSPSDAYTFAKGGKITHPAGFDMQLDVPLDFYGVTDHAFYLGVLREMANPLSEISKHEVAAGMSTLGGAIQRGEKFNEILAFLRSPRANEVNDPVIGKSAWQDIIATANRHN